MIREGSEIFSIHSEFPHFNHRESLNTVDVRRVIEGHPAVLARSVSTMEEVVCFLCSRDIDVVKMVNHTPCFLFAVLFPIIIPAIEIRAHPAFERTSFLRHSSESFP